ncbi:MAG: hypothetical protein WBM62_18565 [Crocosphaera sp.]
MTVLLRFMLAAAVIFCVADITPFPNYPSGLIAKTISQHQHQNDN